MPSFQRTGSCSLASDSLSAEWNVISGTVISIQYGLTHTGVRAQIGRHALLRARWLTDETADPITAPGEPVEMRFPAAAVQLGFQHVWPGKNQWNRWTGRIVFVELGTEHPSLTVKIAGEHMTLRCKGPVLGLQRRPTTWDRVNIVIDPREVVVCPRRAAAEMRRGSSLVLGSRVDSGGQVWVKGRVEAVHAEPSGWRLALSIGDAHVTALLNSNSPLRHEWCTGEEVQVHVSQWKAWVKPVGHQATAIPCSLVY